MHLLNLEPAHRVYKRSRSWECGLFPLWTFLESTVLILLVCEWKIFTLQPFYSWTELPSHRYHFWVPFPPWFVCNSLAHSRCILCSAHTCMWTYVYLFLHCWITCSCLHTIPVSAKYSYLCRRQWPDLKINKFIAQITMASQPGVYNPKMAVGE